MMEFIWNMLGQPTPLGTVLALFLSTYLILWWGYTVNDNIILKEIQRQELLNGQLERRLEIANERILRLEEEVQQLRRIFNP